MGYYLQALIGSSPAIAAGASRFQCAHMVPLTQGLALIPLTDQLYDEIGKENAVDGFDKLSRTVCEWAQETSKVAPVAYIEAASHGGPCGQSSVVWSQGKQAMRPMHAIHAIDVALCELGVKTENAHDEFDAVGLGQHRDTDDWLSLENLQADAKQGHAEAQYKLGNLYSYGKKGLEKDYALAMNWYRKAAEQGLDHAQGHLGHMYEKGQGVQQDCAEAYYWYSLAAKANKYVRSWPYRRDQAMKRLTSEQKTMLDKRVAEWKPTSAQTAAQPSKP